MNFNEKEMTLFSDHFLLNIAMDENLPGGLTAVERDPRKFRIKLSAYVGRVEEVAPTCKLVKVGDKVVVERWEYDQLDIDDERIIAREDQLLILGNQTPAPGVIIFKLFDQTKPVTNLTLPETLSLPEPMSYSGMVMASAREAYEPGEILWFQKSDKGQFRYGDNMMAFRDNGYAEIMMRGWTQAFCEYKRDQLGMDEETFQRWIYGMGLREIQAV